MQSNFLNFSHQNIKLAENNKFYFNFTFYTNLQK
jgi:hypothetical protein